MDQTWDHLFRQAKLEPAARRESLYRLLLSKTTYVIHVAPAGQPAGELRSKPDDAISVWAHRDPEFGGVWVPVFTSREKLARYVGEREPSAPAGQEFCWMEHEPGRVWGLVESVDCFAGVHLDPAADDGLAVSWPEVNALSEGRVPREGPSRYELPMGRIDLPRGTRVALAPMDPELTGSGGLQAFFPDGGAPEPGDLRSLVALHLGPETADEDDAAWTPCRHFALALKRWVEAGMDSSRYADALVRCLMAFEMYGEAEALCKWLSRQAGNEAIAWVFLSAIYGRTGRLDSCTKLCERGIRRYARERAFYLNQARAYSQLDDRRAARESARRGLAHFPNDSALLRFL